MANKFTKSVLERQAKEARQHPSGGNAAALADSLPAPAVEPAEELVVPAPDLVAEPVARQPRATRAAKAAAPSVNLDAFILREESRAAKNKTFYLDGAVIEAIHRAATAQKITDSKLVNDVLKKILGV